MTKHFIQSFIFSFILLFGFSNFSHAGTNTVKPVAADFYQLNGINCNDGINVCQPVSFSSQLYTLTIPGCVTICNDGVKIYWGTSPDIVFIAASIYQLRLSQGITGLPSLRFYSISNCTNTVLGTLSQKGCEVLGQYTDKDGLQQIITVGQISSTPFFAKNQCPGTSLSVVCENGQVFNDSNPVKKGDPINLNNHSVSDSREDITFPISFARTYDTLNSDTGILGLSWVSNFDKTVSIPTSLAQSDPNIAFTTGGVDNSGVSFVAPLTLSNALLLDIKDGLEGHIYFQRNDITSPWIIPVGHFVGYSLVSDPNNNRLIFKKPDGTTEFFDINSGNIIQELFVNGSYFNYSYSNGLLTQVSNNFGQWLQFTYSNYANVVTQINASNGDYVQYNYVGGVLSQTIFDGVETVGYNFQGTYLTDKIDENGILYTHFDYDTNGNAISNYLIVGNNHINEFDFTYNNDGSINESQPNGVSKIHYLSIINGTNKYQGAYNIAGGYRQDSSMNYDSFGNLLSKTDEMGRTTNYTYDGNNYLQSMTKPNGATVNFSWDEVNNLLMSKTEASANGSRTFNYSYDGNRNLIAKTISGAGGTMSWRYTWTADGRISSKTNPNGNTINYSYYPINGSSSSGLVQSISTSGGLTITINSYDNRGNATSITDSNGITKVMTYDIRGRVLSESVGSATNHYSYDMVGNLLNSTFANGYSLTMTYDTAHRLTNINDNMGGSETVTLDNTTSVMTNTTISQGSNLVKVKNQVVNALGQITQTYNSNPGNSYTSIDLFADGSVNTGSDPLRNRINRRVDRIGRTSSYNDGNDYYNYTYDNDSNVNSVTVNNQTTNYAYDDFGRLTQLVSPDTGTKNISYNNSGVTTTTDAKGITHTLTKDLNGNTVSISHSGSGNSLNENFTYDGAGRLTNMSDNSGSTSYGYNNLSLLSSKTQVVNGK